MTPPQKLSKELVELEAEVEKADYLKLLAVRSHALGEIAGLERAAKAAFYEAFVPLLLLTKIFIAISPWFFQYALLPGKD